MANLKRKNDDGDQDNLISELKMVKPVDMTAILLKEVFSKTPITPNNDVPMISSTTIELFKKHPRIVRTLKDIKEQNIKRMEKNSALRAEQQRLQAKFEKAKRQDGSKKKDTNEKKNDENIESATRAKVKSRYVGVVSRSMFIRNVHRMYNIIFIIFVK